MIMINSKSNNKIIYLCSFLVAIYFSYLVCRLWDFSYKSIIFTSLCIVALLLYFTFLYIKRLDKIENITSSRKKILLNISIVLTILILIFKTNFFCASYVPSTIKISSNKSIDKTIIANVYINNIVSDDNSYKIYQVSEREIAIDFPKAHSIKITFNNHLKETNLIISDSNNNFVSAFEGINPYYIFDVKMNCINDKYTCIRMILSVISLLYIFSLFSSYIIISNKEERIKILLMIVSFIILLYYLNNSMIGILFPDSYEYINYDFCRLFNLKLNDRTPIYPIIIAIVSKIYSSNFLEFVCILQYIICFISIVYLYKIFNLLSGKYIFSFIGAILYVLSPAIVGWNNSIITESIALSATIIFIYIIIKYINLNKNKYCYLAILLALILTFHRPTCIIYLVFLFLFLGLKYILEKKNRKHILRCLILSLLSIVFVILYAIQFHKFHTIYSISEAVVRQDLYVSVKQEYYKAGKNKKIIKDIENRLNKYNDLSIKKKYWSTVYYILNKYKLNEIKEFTNYCRRKKHKQYVDYIINLVKNVSPDSFYPYSYQCLNNKTIWLHSTLLNYFTPITFLISYITIIIQAIVAIICWIKRKKPPWIKLGLFAFPLVIIFSSFVGTCDEFMRTSICAVPFVYISIVYFIISIIYVKNIIKFNKKVVSNC